MDNGEALKALRDGTRERIGRLLAAIAHENTPAAAAIRVMATEIASLAELLYSVAWAVQLHYDPTDVAEMRAHVDAIGRALGEHGIIVGNTEWRPGETVLVSTHTHERPPAEEPQPEPKQPPDPPAEQPPQPQEPPGDPQQGPADPAPEGGGAPPI